MNQEKIFVLYSSKYGIPPLASMTCSGTAVVSKISVTNISLSSVPIGLKILNHSVDKVFPNSIIFKNCRTAYGVLVYFATISVVSTETLLIYDGEIR
jgi:hypothetical protein